MTAANALLRNLPHLPPALLLQGVRCTEDGEGQAVLVVGPDCYYVTDGHLTVAGVVEAMAQAAALHPVGSDDPQSPAAAGVLIGLDSLEVRQLPRVGQTVAVSCRVERHVGPALWLDARLLADDEHVASGTVKLFLTPPEPSS